MAALARQLARGHEVTVLTSRAKGQSARSLEDGVEVIRVPVFFRRQQAVANFPSMLAFLLTGFIHGVRLMRERRFDVINTHFVLPTGPVGHLLARFYGLPNVLSAHGGDLYDPSKKLSPHRHAPLRAAVRWLIQEADVLVGQSQDTLRRARDIYGLRRQMELIPLGIERPPVPDAVSRTEFGLPADAFVMVTVGRLVARKNNKLLIKALSKCPRKDAHLAIVGGGPEAKQLAQLASSLGLEERVHLLGALPDEQKYRLLSVADIFVSASQHEGFGLVFLEAMACALPVVCFDRGGQMDFLRNGKTGRIVALNDLEGLTAAMAELHSDVTNRRKMGNYNRELVERYFIDTCAATYEQTFSTAINPWQAHSQGGVRNTDRLRSL